MKPLIWPFLILSLISHPSFSQNRTSVISHYVFPEFVEGEVLMKNGLKNKVLINYNTVTEEMVFVSGSLKFAIAKTESELIDTVYIEGRKFIRLEHNFVEIIYRSKTVDLFVQYKCKWEKSDLQPKYGLSNRGGRTQIHTINLSRYPDNHKIDPYVVYWIKKNGKIYEAINKREIGKAFEDNMKQFKKYVKENKVEFEDMESVKGLVSYLDSTKLNPLTYP